ncbi:hypothetical protein HALLA_07100 [Halostagnicola larsenii XH-48]|uniref:PGF-CTERM sorting domain-containing protein n=1 Tax=Halostagnicola larsenii XH-48 TaxID=797299 RepID=W0JNS2_9EURY|nr:hypothetical protein [Halostagnicola larsenii]AHF98652.1 hypothetical protein HALLA_07100 [Halostagnicola larsenii XH-48]
MGGTDSSGPTTDARVPGQPPNRRRTIRTVIATVAILVAVGSTAIGPVAVAGAESTPSATVGSQDAAADPTLVVSNETVDPQSTATHRIALTDAPDGLAGFEVTLALETEGVATIGNASYPDRFGLTTDPVVSSDEQTVTVEAIDLEDAVTSGETDVTLAEIDVTGVDHGETNLRVSDAQLDADGGDAIDPARAAGTLTVGDGGEESASQNESAEDDGSDGDSVPGFAIGPALAAIAALTITLVARRS